MVRVCLVLEQCLAPAPGGTGRYAGQIARALARHAVAGETVASVTGWHRDLSPARIDGVLGPTRLPLGRRGLALAWGHSVGPRPKGDVVHAPTLLVPPVRVPLVVTIHDAVPWTHPETLTVRGAAWHRAMAARAARDAAAVVVPTRAVATELEPILALGSRMHVIGHGVDDATVTPPADADRRARRLDLPAGGFFFTLATLEPRKGLDTLIEACAQPGASPLPLLVAGAAGWGGVDPLAFGMSVGLPPGRIRMLGQVSDPDVAVLLSRATALVAPSRAEGFGMPVLEAMAAGLPVVTSDAPALVEVGGGATLVVPREDPVALAAALAAVAVDGELRARLAMAGRTRSAAYSWDAAADKLWRIYRELRWPGRAAGRVARARDRRRLGG